MAIGINWAEVWGPVWGPVWSAAAADPPAEVISLGGSRNRRESPAAQAAMLELAQQQEAEARDLREVHEIIAALFAFEGVF